MVSVRLSSLSSPSLPRGWFSLANDHPLLVDASQPVASRRLFQHLKALSLLRQAPFRVCRRQRPRSLQRDGMRSGISREGVLARQLHVFLEGQFLQLRRLPITPSPYLHLSLVMSHDALQPSLLLRHLQQLHVDRAQRDESIAASHSSSFPTRRRHASDRDDARGPWLGCPSAGSTAHRPLEKRPSRCRTAQPCRRRSG